jgi:trk system potassium uptake protein TrkH
MPDLRPVAFVIGAMLAAFAAAMLLPLAVALAHDGPDWVGFAGAAGLTAFCGGGAMLAAHAPGLRLAPRQAFLLATSSWAVVAAFGALPFLLSPLGLDAADAFFESMSGLTTTGATVIVGLDDAPHGILLWRSLLQFIGGVGIVAVAIAVFPLLRIGGMQLFRLEFSEKTEKVMPRVAQAAIGIIVIYLVLAFVCGLLYWACGMSGFDALNHAMTTVATSGFSTSDRSFGKFDAPLLQAVATLFMLLGALSFVLYLRVWQSGLAPLRHDSQARVFLGAFVVAWGAVAAWLVLAEGRPALEALRLAGFNVASIVTTTGYMSEDWTEWGSFPVVLFFLLGFVGGCSGSTAGGMKMFRFQVLFQVGRAQLRHALLPSGVFPAKYNGKPITDAVAQSVLAFITLYGFSWALTAAALGLCGLDLVTALSGAAAAIGNIGPGLGDTIGPAGSYAPLPDSAKWVLAGAMLLGRLELITILVLFTRRFWRD